MSASQICVQVDRESRVHFVCFNQLIDCFTEKVAPLDRKHQYGSRSGLASYLVGRTGAATVVCDCGLVLPDKSTHSNEDLFKRHSVCVAAFDINALRGCS